MIALLAAELDGARPPRDAVRRARHRVAGAGAVTAREPAARRHQMALYEADHVASTFARMEQSDPPFDVLHDHCGFTAFAFADRIDTPVVHTLHGPFTEDTSGVLRAARPQGERRGAQPLPGRAGAGRARRGGGDRQPDRRRRLPLPRREGRLPALDRAPQRRQGPAARDRGGARGRRAARARRPGAARPGGVLRERGGASHRRRRASATSARWARRRATSTPAPARC